MKKIIPILTVIFLLLTGCTKEESKKEEEIIEKNAMLHVAFANKEEQTWLEEVAKAYTKKTGVQINLMPQSTDSKADVFILRQEVLPDFVKTKQIQPISLDKDTYITQAIDGVRVKEATYGYPLSITTYGLFYNKELVQELPATMEEFLATAEKITNKKEKTYGFLVEVNRYYYMNSLLAPLTEPEQHAFLTQLHTIIPLSADVLTHEEKERLFVEGHVAFQVNNFSMRTHYEQAGINVGVTTLPSFANGKQPTPFSSTKALVIASATKYPKTANDFAAFASNEENAIAFALPIHELPANNYALENKEIKENAYLQVFAKQVSMSIAVPNDEEIDWTEKNKQLGTQWNKEKPAY